MGWDEKFLKIVPSHGTKKFLRPIPWDGIPFRNLSSHPMGWDGECVSHGTVFYVPSHPTRSPGPQGTFFNLPCPALREKMVYKKISFLPCPVLCHRTGQDAL